MRDIEIRLVRARLGEGPRFNSWGGGILFFTFSSIPVFFSNLRSLHPRRRPPRIRLPYSLLPKWEGRLTYDATGSHSPSPTVIAALLLLLLPHGRRSSPARRQRSARTGTSFTFPVSVFQAFWSLSKKFLKGLNRMLAGVARGSPPKVVEIFQKTATRDNRIFPPQNPKKANQVYYGRWDWGKTLDTGERMLKYQANRHTEDAGWTKLACETPHGMCLRR